MQATVMVETDPGKSYHRNGRNLQKDKPSNPKKDNFLSSSGCNEVKLTFPDDEWDSLALGPRTNDDKINSVDKTDLMEPSFSVNQDTNTESAFSQSSEFEDGIDCAFLNETYSIHYSESKLKNENLTRLCSELHPNMHKSEEVFFNILEPQGHNGIGFEITHKTAEDVQKNDTDDSQQEYHSAQQEYHSAHNYLSFDQAKALSISNLYADELEISGYEVKCVSDLEDSHAKLESGPVTSLDSLNGFAQDCPPGAFKFQDSDMLKEHHGPKHGKGKQQELSLPCHAALDDFVQRRTSLLHPQKPLNTKIYAEEKSSQTTESKGFCGDGIVKNRSLQHLESPGTLPQADKDYQTCGSSIFDDSVISLCGSSQYKSLQSTPNPAFGFSPMLPRIAITDKQAGVEDSSPQLLKSSAIGKTCSHALKETCLQSLPDAASCTVTVNQMLDVTSRATSARSSVMSLPSNTERMRVSKNRPDDWQCERRSVACSTDWSCNRDCADVRMAIPKGLGRSLSADCLKPNGNPLNETFLELRKTSATTDVKKYPEREFQLCEEMDLPSKCCQKAKERAVKAEMHLLNVCYQMCHHHCCDIYKLVMGNRAGLNRNLPSDFAKKELGSALLSVWGDLKVRYMNLKEKIQKGVPLEELPPLSVESKLLSAFSTFASKLIKEESRDFSGADSDLDNQSVPDVDVSLSLKKTLSQMTVLSDSSHPKQDKSPKKDGLRNGDINIDQLRLDDKRKYTSVLFQTAHEEWFDAKEKLMGADVSGIQDSLLEQSRWSPKFPLEMKTVELLKRDKGFLIHLGGLCSSVSEADLWSHFQKYQVSEVSIFDSPTNYRYASLAFTNNNDAKMAVKEMNGIEINGKSVTVRLVKTPGEYTARLCAKSGNKVSLNHLEKNTNKEGISVSSVPRLPKTRPRRLESEQDREFSSLDQEGVKKNCKQIDSIRLLPEIPVQPIPPNTLNLRSFTKITKRLAELHPEVSRDRIINALQEVRVNHKGFLNGLSISAIVEMTSSFLRNSVSH
uniref:RNA binding motif protein 44 n=1 Tax=Nannospalax galili TaxID=1026970 RepID=A0A8C6RBR3_NANGA